MASRARAALAVACLLSASAASAAPDCWRAAGQRHGIDPLLLYAIASAESSLDARAINRNRDGSHDIGLMQINSMHLPDLARQGITRQRLLDEPCLSIDVGASILSGFIRRHGRTWRAVGAYNAGSAANREAARTRYVERVWPLYLELAGERERRRRVGG
ncbi:lytic transglycosylase domain-containing protein [Achromobacter sp. AONIH1]|uniref:lytic transglycosylase domain-containing protein n=1 Tax=unclassified Achromobacter TaxID=2626865 RepID=UPI000CD116AB|nr:lytic transglycosylase domain-containing protein [Achromobacter sp. AONIH1]AUT46406.1 invasion protein IagB [Achromobacter sp. AONIH1]